MKKFILATLFGLSLSAMAGDYAALEVEHVKDRSTQQVSQAQYIRIGKEVGGLQFGLQSRTARYDDSTGMFNSVELTAGKHFGGFLPYAGVGYDNGKNGHAGSQYSYGLVGAQYIAKAGPGLALVGAKTRVNWDDANPKQTVAYGSYIVPINKTFAATVNVSRTYSDIRENAYGVGLNVSF